MKNFTIDKNQEVISEEFLNRNILDFHSACKYVQNCPTKEIQTKRISNVFSMI